MADEWKTLVQRYAAGRQVCNCGGAYYTNCGTASKLDAATGQWVTTHDNPCCQHGCQANLHAVKDDIAKRVISEIGWYTHPGQGG